LDRYRLNPRDARLQTNRQPDRWTQGEEEMIQESKNPKSVLGVGWYRPEQWALLLAKSVDRDQLESTHAEWLAQAETSLDRIRAAGQNPVKIDIDVEDMIAWCAKQGIPMDGDARSQYIADQTRLRDQRS
jgi:hypothetical protein